MRRRKKDPSDYEYGDPDLVRAKSLINRFFFDFYDRDDYAMANYADLTEVCLLFSQTQGKAHWIQVDVDLVNFKMKRYYDWKLTHVTAYKSLYVMNKELLEKMNIYTLMNIPKEEVEIANAQNQYDCVNDIIKIITYDEDANPEIFTPPYTVDCVKKALATIINRLPEGEDNKFSPQNREWAKDITDEIWQADKIDFDPEVLDQFTEFVKDYEKGEQQDKSRDVVNYKREFLADPRKREIYEFADSLDRLQIAFDRDSYCDNKVDSDDNMEKIYNQVVSHNTGEITTFLNSVNQWCTSKNVRKWAGLLSKQLNHMENGIFRYSYMQQNFEREGNSYVFPDFSKKDKDGWRKLGTGVVDLAVRIVMESNQGFCKDDKFEAELALYSALIGYLYYTRSKRSTFKDLHDLANTFEEDEGAVRERILGRKGTRQGGEYPFYDYGNLSIAFMQYEYDQFLNYAEVPYGQYVDDLLEWLDHNNLCR